jgi:Domain of unknown function (DUF4158)
LSPSYQAAWHKSDAYSSTGFSDFSLSPRDTIARRGHSLEDLAAQIDKGIVLATALIQSRRSQAILLPSINVIERICSEAITRATRRIHVLLTESLAALIGA